MRARNNSYYALGLCIMTVLFGIYYQLTSPALKPALNKATQLSIPQALPKFKLINTQHQAFTNETLKDHWTLLFFGYTNCPDICPATLYLLTETWRMLPPKFHSKGRMAFVSVNSSVDSIEKLTDFLSKFNPNFIGVTGEAHEMQILKKALGIFANAQIRDGKPIINHSSSLMLINPKGELAAVFTPAFSAEELAHDLLLLAR